MILASSLFVVVSGASMGLKLRGFKGRKEESTSVEPPLPPLEVYIWDGRPPDPQTKQLPQPITNHVMQLLEEAGYKPRLPSKDRILQPEDVVGLVTRIPAKAFRLLLFVNLGVQEGTVSGIPGLSTQRDGVVLTAYLHLPGEPLLCETTFKDPHATPTSCVRSFISWLRENSHLKKASLL